MVDKLADHPQQINVSPFAYAGNNPISRIDPDGNCWPCLIELGVAAYEAITVTHVVVTGAALTATAITMNGINSYSRNRDYSVQDNTSVSRPKLQAILKTEDTSKAKDDKGTKKENKVKPDSEADGDHSTLKRSEDGEITNTATYKKNPQNPSGFDEVKRVDVKGEPHFDKKTGTETPTPHVHEKDKVRPAKPEELPKKNN
ncbi:hypothetical protein HDE69_001177 [Pedobacter cryoconitis]|uniref:RHS repeat-associated protein n=1 Tax=Pedobacter cryoconitis TaxID=188932 RepID=A0A7W9DIX9_9SPHI|nr:hypothetical protein [Pedobacter cryoconitis]